MSDWFDFFNAYRAPAQHLSSVLLAAAIWRWGGRPERWLMAVFLATMVFPVYLARWLNAGTALEIGPNADYVMLLDMIAGVLFVGIALKANRNYPLWIAGFQLVAVATHLVRGVVDGILPLAVAILVIGPSYCQLAILAGGFGRHVLRVRRFGNYRDWRPTPSRAPGMLF